MVWSRGNALRMAIGTILVLWRPSLGSSLVSRSSSSVDISSETTFAVSVRREPGQSTTPTPIPLDPSFSSSTSADSGGGGGGDPRVDQSTTPAAPVAPSAAASAAAAAAASFNEPDYLNSIEFSPLAVNHTLQKQLRIEAIKQDILNRLGMTRVPDVSRVNMTVHERRQILRLYRKSVEELHGKNASSLLFDDDQFYANQFQSFTEGGDRPSSVADRLWRSPAAVKRIFFSVDIPEPADPRKETIVKSATLKLYKRDLLPQNLADRDRIDRSVRIDIHQVLLPPAADRLLRRSVDSRLVALDKAGWEEFDISRAVQDWIRDPSSNLGLEISCDVRYRMEDLLTFVTWSPSVADNPYLSSLLPVLNVLTQEKRILGRQKRSLPERSDCLVGDGEDRCCRFPFTVRFRDIDWHQWVIHPLSYQAYYCQGSCPPNYKVAHRFSRLKLLLSERNPGMPLSVGCKETRMGSLNIAHYNSEGVLVVSIIENMFPTECMCA